jgi:hypothetical protein
MRNFIDLKKPLIAITLLSLVSFVVSYLWMGLASLPPPFIYDAISTTGLLLALLFFVNLGFALFRSQQRRSHLIMVFMIAIAIVLIIPVCGKLIGNRQRQWFLQGGIQTYEATVNKITQNRSTLTSTNSLLNEVLGLKDKFRIYGMTNADGSITVRFFGRGNSWRRGYLYYSGNQMIANPSETNTFYLPENPYQFYLRVTNDWYEF